MTTGFYVRVKTLHIVFDRFYAVLFIPEKTDNSQVLTDFNMFSKRGSGRDPNLGLHQANANATSQTNTLHCFLCNCSH